MAKELHYVQSTGRLYLHTEGENPALKSLGSGYSGHPPYVNEPEAEALIARGPIPRGDYRLIGPFDHVRLGKIILHLEPEKGNDMRGRSGFLIHGDNSFGNRSASHGCIVLKRSIREAIVASGARKFRVV